MSVKGSKSSDTNRWLALSCFEQLIFSQNLTIPYSCNEYFHFLLVTNSYNYSHIYSITLVKNLIQTPTLTVLWGYPLAQWTAHCCIKEGTRDIKDLERCGKVKHLLGPFSHNPPSLE